MLTYDHKLTLERKRREAEWLRARASRIDAMLKRIEQYRATGERLRAVDRFAEFGRVTRLASVMRHFADYRHLTDAELHAIFTPQGLRAFYKARYSVHEVINSEGVTLYQVGFKHYPDNQYVSRSAAEYWANLELDEREIR
jgi:hypothetical protein